MFYFFFKDFFSIIIFCFISSLPNKMFNTHLFIYIYKSHTYTLQDVGNHGFPDLSITLSNTMLSWRTQLSSPPIAFIIWNLAFHLLDWLSPKANLLFNPQLIQGEKRDSCQGIFFPLKMNATGYAKIGTRHASSTFSSYNRYPMHTFWNFNVV